MTDFKIITETIVAPTIFSIGQSSVDTSSFANLTKELNSGYDIVSLQSHSFSTTDPNDQTIHQLCIVAVLRKRDGHS